MANASNKAVSSSNKPTSSGKSPSSKQVIVPSKPGFFAKIPKFVRETWVELKKTSWPNKNELKKGTILVLAAVLIVMVWIGGLDAVLRFIATALKL